MLGAVEVGLVRALLEFRVRRDLTVGASIGAVNGVLVASDPAKSATARLVELWASESAREAFGDCVPSAGPLRRMPVRELAGAETFEELPKVLDVELRSRPHRWLGIAG